MSGDQTEEKTDPASSRKLDKLREDGIIPSSQTGTNYFSFAVGLAVSVFVIAAMYERVVDGFDIAFQSLGSATVTDTDRLKYFFMQLHLPIVAIFASVIAASMLFKLLVNNGIPFSMKPLTPELSKVSPMAGLKRIFKGLSLTEFAATFVRFFILVAVFVMIGYIWGPTLINIDMCSPGCVPGVMIDVMRAIVLALLAVIIVTIIFDVAIQRVFFMQENRMTKTEVKQEQKEQMGQPEIRQERRRLARELLEEAGTTGQSAATVFFHYGDSVVAFAFHPEKVPLPKIAAKSLDARKTIELIQILHGRGLPGIENGEIVNACIDLPVGSPPPRKIFMPLAKELRQLFG